MKYREIIRVMEDYDETHGYIVLDKPYFTRPTKLTNSIHTIEVMFCGQIDKHKFAHNLRHLKSNPHYKVNFKMGESLIEIEPNIKVTCVDDKFLWYVEDFKSLIEKGHTDYLEEELVPSQFFGLNDYLNCRI